MKHITEGQAWKEYHARKGVPRPPLRSLKELSEELGVPVKTFSGKLKMEGAPKPVLSKSISGWGRSVTYYNPTEFKKWWTSIAKEK